jgi:hypothetical protein
MAPAARASQAVFCRPTRLCALRPCEPGARTLLCADMWNLLRELRDRVGGFCPLDRGRPSRPRGCRRRSAPISTESSSQPRPGTSGERSGRRLARVHFSRCGPLAELAAHDAAPPLDDLDSHGAERSPGERLRQQSRSTSLDPGDVLTRSGWRACGDRQPARRSPPARWRGRRTRGRPVRELPVLCPPGVAGAGRPVESRHGRAAPAITRWDGPSPCPRARATGRHRRARARRGAGGCVPHQPPDFGSPADSLSRVPWLCVPGSPRVCLFGPASWAGAALAACHHASNCGSPCAPSKSSRTCPGLLKAIGRGTVPGSRPSPVCPGVRARAVVRAGARRSDGGREMDRR